MQKSTLKQLAHYEFEHVEFISMIIFDEQIYIKRNEICQLYRLLLFYDSRKKKKLFRVCHPMY